MDYNCYYTPLYPFFFYQAEDGIRDATVTGVHTCALPISVRGFLSTMRSAGINKLPLISRQASLMPSLLRPVPISRREKRASCEPLRLPPVLGAISRST